VRSLRGRLTVGVTALLAAVIVAVGAVASDYAEDSERDALDDRLRRTAELSSATARAAIDEELPEGDRRLDAVLRATGTSLRLLLGDAVLLATGAPPPSSARPRPGLATLTEDGRRFRSYATTLQDPALGGLAVLQVTTPLGPLERRQADLRRRLALLGLLAVVVAGAGVWLAASLVLRPLARLRALTASIAGSEDLERRRGEVRTGAGPAELRSLATSFDAMLDRLARSAADRERALAATRRFTADAGHELRTPLTSVLATLSALRRHPEVDGARRDAMLDDALGEHRRLVELLDGLQSLARGDAAPPAVAAVDLAEVVAAAVAAARARHDGAAAFAAALPGEGAALVRAWEPGLRLVADNLLENAVRHGGGRIAVTVAVEDDGARVLRVDDRGPGVPEPERARVFEPFARVGGTAAPGSGLGLALVAQQVRHAGGTVAVTDAPGGGARFEVRLPAPGAWS